MPNELIKQIEDLADKIGDYQELVLASNKIIELASSKEGKARLVRYAKQAIEKNCTKYSHTNPSNIELAIYYYNTSFAANIEALANKDYSEICAVYNIIHDISIGLFYNALSKAGCKSQ